MSAHSSPSPPSSLLENYDTPNGLTLQVDFLWSKFHNTISEKNGSSLTPLYIQHFRLLKPQLRFEDVITNTHIATGTINNISIAAECTINGHAINIKPLKKWKTAYNYLSTAVSSTSTPTPVMWITNSSLKVWEFVCLESNTQLPIAKFSVNWWALKQVGNFYFEKSAAQLSKELRDEIVVVGLTIFYVMTTRINNPLNIGGSIFTKVGKVEEQNAGDLELEERLNGGTKHKQA